MLRPFSAFSAFECDNGWHCLVPAVARFAFIKGTAFFIYTGAARFCPAGAFVSSPAWKE
jgi:hypothetical protein